MDVHFGPRTEVTEDRSDQGPKWMYPLLSLGRELVGGKPMKSVTHGQCDARPTVTFPAAVHHRPLTSTRLYCLATEAHVCEQLA